MARTVKAYALFLPELKQLLESGELETLRRFLKEVNPVDLAEGWPEFSRQEQLTLFQLLDTRKMLALFEELDAEDQVFLLQRIGDQATGEMVSQLPPAEVAHLFRKLPHRVIRRLRSLVKRRETVERLDQVLSYPPDTAGALMHTGFIPLRENLTASQALEKIRLAARSHSAETELLSILYVVNGAGRLLGYVSLQRLVAAPHTSRLRELAASTQGIEIPALADQEEAARMVSKYNLVAAPVVEESGRLVGVLLVDDVLEVLSEEATEDIAKLGGTDPEILTSRSLLRTTGLRLPWLMVTFAGQLVVAAVISRFEAVLSQVIAMVSFMPIIAALGGNIGSQSATITVRGLATGEFADRHAARQVGRELMTGLMCGLLYGAILGGIAYLAYGARFSEFFAVSVGLAVGVSMTIAATMGGLVPFVFRRIGVDPAAASAPLISTATDLLSVTVYFLLAAALLKFM